MVKYPYRDVVQLVERTVRDREVSSSSLLIPTILQKISSRIKSSFHIRHISEYILIRIILLSCNGTTEMASIKKTTQIL